MSRTYTFEAFSCLLLSISHRTSNQYKNNERNINTSRVKETTPINHVRAITTI